MKELHFSNLGDVITFERGLTYSKADEVPESAIGVLRSNNVDLYNHSLNLDEIKFLNPSFVVPANKKVRKDSILMCMSNGSKEHLGKVAIIDKDLDYAFGGFMGLLTPNKAKVYPKYLYYTLISPDFKKHIRGLSDGANINNLKYADLSSFSFALFPIQEQQRIVGILDAEFEKIDALKANAEKNLQNAKDLFQAALKETYYKHTEWNWDMIGHLCKTGAGGTPSKLCKEYYEGGTIPWLRSGEVCHKEIWSVEMYITNKGLRNSSAKWFPVDTVLVAMYGATAGQVGILKVPSTTNQAVCGILPNERFLPEFLYYTLLHSQKGLVAKATGNAQPNISQIKIKETKIPVIGIDEQKVVVSTLNSFDAKCAQLQDNYTQTIALCDDLKQALLRKAFSGEL